jgi:pimeloyl-ACP methyl ester carboxylesterase
MFCYNKFNKLIILLNKKGFPIMNKISQRLERATQYLEKVAAHSQSKAFDSEKAHRCVLNVQRILENEYVGREWNPDTDQKKTIERIQKSIKIIHNNQEDFYSKNQLDILDKEIEDLFKIGTIKKIFKADHVGQSLAKNLQAPFRAILHFLTKRIAKSIRLQVYHGWSRKIKDQKIKDLVQEEYKAKYANWYKAEKAAAHSLRKKQEIEEVYDDEMAHINRAVAEDSKVKNIDATEKKAEETRKLFMDIGGERIQLQTSDGVKLDSTYLSADEFRHALKNQGGKHVTYTSPHGREFSGISIKPNDKANQQLLINKLKKLGLLSDQDKPGSGYGLLYDEKRDRFVIMSKNDLQIMCRRGRLNFEEKEGLYKFVGKPYARTSQKPLETADDEKDRIEKFGGRFLEIHVKGEKEPIPAFSLAHAKNQPGYIGLKIPSDKPGEFKSGTYYIQQTKADELVRAGSLTLVNGEYKWKNPKNVKATRVDRHEWKLRQEGVAILSSGNAGVYEMHKGEALALLMNGCDVMMLNLRGYGDSEGEPTVEGSYQDLEAAYQYVKHHRKGIADSKITAWALCLSGGIAAHLAERHPYINLFLNQTYAELWDIVKPTIEDELDGFLKKYISPDDHNALRNAIKKCLLPIVLNAVKLVAPNYNVKDRLEKIKGKVCVMEATEDELMLPEETEKMRAAIKGKNVDCEFVDIPGGHCSPWNQVVIYKTRNKEEVMAENYVGVELDGKNLTYISKEDLRSSKKFEVTINGYTYYCRFENKEDPDSQVKVEVYKNDSHGRQHFNQNLTLPAFEITEKLIPDFVYKLELTPEFRGHHHVQEFIKRADLGTPLIAI